MPRLSNIDNIRQSAERDLEKFIRLIAPQRVLGSIHQEICAWWDRSERKPNSLLLLPRDHQKSWLLAARCAQRIAKQPDVRILYLSSTANLAAKQLKSIKDIITSDIFRAYWPGHVKMEEGKRAKWTNSEIEIDHPLRKEEGIRDPTVFTGGLTTSLTGFHADVVALDDVVVFENAYTREGREKVKSQYSLLNSVASTDAEEWVTGTRYEPRDLYGDLIQMEMDKFDPQGNVIGTVPVYEVFERQVEGIGDGSGAFLWPRQQRYDGKWFGFNQEILAQKRAKYLDRRQFRAQYYNDPNDVTDAPIDRGHFQYYNKQFLTRQDGVWSYQGRRLNIFASIDFAFSMSKKADFTALVVIGMDFEKNIYVLDIARIKTDKISEYYKLILDYHVKWDFRKLRAETSAGQAAVVRELKGQYLKRYGIALSIDEFKPNRYGGSKEERIQATLEPRYDNMSIWHYRGGECQTLEDELVLRHPPHDDVKDALASAIDVAMPPMRSRGMTTRTGAGPLLTHPKFGGVAF